MLLRLLSGLLLFFLVPYGTAESAVFHLSGESSSFSLGKCLFLVLFPALLLSWGGIFLLCLHSARQKRERQRLVLHLDFFRLLSELTRLLLKHPELSEALREICRHLRHEMDAALELAVFRNVSPQEGTPFPRLAGSSLEEEGPSFLPLLFSYDMVPGLAKSLSEGTSSLVSAETLLFREGFRKEDLQERTPRSLFSLPIGVNGKWWGTLMLLSEEASPSWSDRSCTQLWEVFSEILGLYLMRKEMEDELREMATTDFLTGTWNRRNFIDSAEREILRSQRHGHDLAMILWDIDNFKDINDTFGHPLGDHVLQELSALALKGFRSEDMLGRLGGEEFGILLPETNLSVAKSVAERFRFLVEQHDMAPSEKEGKPIHITITCGIASLKGEEDSFFGLYERADEALYRAKKRGKNRICTEEECPLS